MLIEFMLKNNPFLQFIISKKLFQVNTDLQMSISDHLSELRQRLFSILLLCISTVLFICFFLKDLIIILQKPAIGIKFLQLAPGEYFFVSVKVAVYSGIILSSPFAIFQLMLFVLPGLTVRESKIIVPALISSVVLFFLGMIFSYSLLIPAALNFLIHYGSDIIEPFWSFEQYFDFISVLLISTGFVFQVPIIQVALGFANIISSSKMLAVWQYVVLFSMILGAILTPSTDPITQIMLATAILLLYFLGILILVYFEK